MESEVLSKVFKDILMVYINYRSKKFHCAISIHSYNVL
jgi:hypothetical protein